MHILIIPSEHVATDWAPLGGIFQLDLARALVAAGNQVGVLSVGKFPGYKMIRGWKYPQIEMLDGVKIFRKYIECPIPQKYDHMMWLGGIYSRTAYPIFLDYCRNYGVPDLIHAHNFRYAGIVANNISAKENIPFVVTEHSSDYNTGVLNKCIINRVLPSVKMASGISAVSRSFANVVTETLGLNSTIIKVIQNSLPIEFSSKELDGGCEKASIPRGSKIFTFLNVAELVPIKNQKLLLHAFSIAMKAKPARLRIVGDGPLKNELIKITKELGVDSQVEFIGRLSREGVKKEMQLADSFILSSNSETFGVVLIESLSQGLPVISTSCGGPNDIVNASNGLLIQPKDLQALILAMQTIYEGLVSFNRRSIVTDCLSLYSPRNVASKYLSFYHDAIRKFSNEQFRR